MTLLQISLEDRTGPKYIAIADALGDAIQTGTIKPGTQLPTHRALANQLKVTVGTVTRAYTVARERGLISGEVGRGSFVRHLPPAEFSLSHQNATRAFAIDLRQNNPVQIPEVEHRIMQAIMAEFASDPNLTQYTGVVWQPTEIRQQQAGVKWIERLGWSPQQENVYVCSGVQPAICAVLAAVCSPGDTVLAPSLSYPGFRAIAHHFALSVHGLTMDDDGICPAALDEACQSRNCRLLYIAPTLQTPTGITMSESRRQEIAEVATKHNLCILEDDDSAFLKKHPIPPIASFAPDRTFLVADTTRALSLGLRTTYVAAPTPYRDQMWPAMTSTMWMHSPILAEMTARIVESESANALIAARQSELAQRHALAQSIFQGKNIRTDPASHHMWLDLSSNAIRSEYFVALAAQQDIGITSAEWFAIPNTNVPEAVRICLGVAPHHEALRQGLTTLARLVDHCPTMPTTGPLY